MAASTVGIGRRWVDSFVAGRSKTVAAALADVADAAANTFDAVGVADAAAVVVANAEALVRTAEAATVGRVAFAWRWIAASSTARASAKRRESVQRSSRTKVEENYKAIGEEIA